MEDDRQEAFTVEALEALNAAETHALLLRNNYIGSEHLLLGLLSLERGPVYRAFTQLGITLSDARKAVLSIVGLGVGVSGEVCILTPRARKMLSLAVQEAANLDRAQVDSVDILLGLLREGDGIAIAVIESLGVTIAELRAKVLRAVEMS